MDADGHLSANLSYPPHSLSTSYFYLNRAHCIPVYCGGVLIATLLYQTAIKKGHMSNTEERRKLSNGFVFLERLLRIHIIVFHLIYVQGKGFCDQPSNHHQQGQSTLPPAPPPHKQQPSVTALNHNSLSSRRNVSPAPPAALPAELQTTPESVPLQDSWVLGSNVPLESRKLAKQAVLENGHDNLIEMDVFPPVCHEGDYGDGYVLLSFLMVPAADAKPNTEPTKVLNLQTPHPNTATSKQKASAEPTKWPKSHIKPTEFRQSSLALAQAPIIYLFPCSVSQ
ncbi:hypothetical protein PO909_015406 [Leuciscus waleckii]